nr:hypothetical protein [Tanacetum cinerariifolium]
IKGIARDTDESPPKLIKASTDVHQDLDAPVVILYEINEVLHHLTNKQLQAHIDKEEKLEKAVREPRLSKPELIKVIHKVAKEDVVDPKALQDSQGVYRGNDQRNFEVHDPYRFGSVKVIKWDELVPIIQNKKKKVVGELMTSLGKKYDKQKVTLRELGINPTLLALGQVLSLTLR